MKIAVPHNSSPFYGIKIKIESFLATLEVYSIYRLFANIFEDKSNLRFLSLREYVL